VFFNRFQGISAIRNDETLPFLTIVGKGEDTKDEDDKEEEEKSEKEEDNNYNDDYAIGKKKRKRENDGFLK
jgi:hypothetical protein